MLRFLEYDSGLDASRLLTIRGSQRDVTHCLEIPFHRLIRHLLNAVRVYPI